MCVIRKCSECGDEMMEGFVIDDGREYYCIEECLQKNYTKEEIEELFSNDEDSVLGNSNYWTEWYD